MDKKKKKIGIADEKKNDNIYRFSNILHPWRFGYILLDLIGENYSENIHIGQVTTNNV